MNGKQLKNSILQWAIQGKLVSQDPNDEPASVLLERIRQEKERLIKEKKIKRDKNASIIYRGENNSYYEKFLATGEVKCIDEEIPFEIPQGWEWTRLKHITYLIEDCPHSTAKDEGKGYPLVRTPNIGFGQLLLNGVHRVSEKVYNQRNIRAVPQKNDLIFAREAPAGNIAVINEEKVCLGQRTVLLRPITHCILPQYLAYYILAPSSQQNLVEKSSGTTVAHVNLSDFRPYMIAVPPIEEQNRIVNKIIELLPLIEKYSSFDIELARINDEIGNRLKKSVLQEAIQGRLVPQIEEEGTARELLDLIRQEKQRLVKEGKIKKSALTDSVIYKGDDNKYFEKVGKTEQDITDEIPFEIPDDWKWCRIGSVLNIWSARRVHERDWRSSGIPFYRAREIGKMADWGHVDNDLFIEQSLYDEFSKSGVPQIGDLMMTAVGTLGKTYVVETNNPFYYKDGSVLCIGNPFRLNPYYLKLFFESSAFANQYLSESDGTTVATLTMVRLNRYLIPVPPLKEQTRIVEKIKTVTSIMSR